MNRALLLRKLRAWRHRPTTPQQVAIGLMIGIFAIGLLTVVQKISSQLPDISHINRGSDVKTSQVLDVSKADFQYLVPGKNDAWLFDAGSPAYEKNSGVVKYGVKLNYSGLTLTMSQQKMPDQLKPKDSEKFRAFINNANPSRSQNAGRGTVYFLTALENGAPANGADTVIFATDDVLMFGKAGRVVGYDAWAQMLATMKPH